MILSKLKSHARDLKKMKSKFLQYLFISHVYSEFDGKGLMS